MTMLLEFLERHRARHLFRSSHLKAAGDKLLINKFIWQNFGGGLTLKNVIS